MWVTILMKSKREINTNHNWDEMKSIINENPYDGEMVVQEVVDNNKFVWTCIKKDEIEGYRNIN
jgi:hypothetical protein